VTGVRFPAEARNFLFSVVPRPALGTSKPHIKWLWGSIPETKAAGEAVPRRRPGFEPVLDLWWTKWHCGRFSQSTLVSSANSHSTDCSTIIIIIIIIIYHLGLVQ
jgi:hypothetical protein